MDPLPEAPPSLPDDVLARRDQLPHKPAPAVLTGQLVELRPLDLAGDLAALYAVSNGQPFTLGTRTVDAYDSEARIWRYMFNGPFGDAAALGVLLGAQDRAPDGRPFTVRDRTTGTPIGIANLLANQPAHLKVELGSIWFGPIVHGTGAAREAIRLLLGHVFALGYRRVDWKCDARNTPSRRSALSYGFTFEGIQDCHLIIKGRSRDTAWYRMLDRDWRER